MTSLGRYSSLAPMEIGDHPCQHSKEEVDDDTAPGLARSLVFHSDLGRDSDEDLDSPVGRVRLTRHSVLSFSFLTLTMLSAAIFTFVPFVIFSHHILYELTGRYYFALPIAIIRTLDVSCTYLILSRTNNLTNLPASCFRDGRGAESNNNCSALFLVVFWAEVSFLLHGLLVPSLFSSFRRNFFTEPDGTTAVEWRDLERTFYVATIWSGLAALVDLSVAALGVSILCIGSSSEQKRPICAGFRYRQLSIGENYFAVLESRRISDIYRRLVLVSLILTFGFLFMFGASASIYLPARKPPDDSNIGPFCDPLDETECMFPFPSSFFTREDNTTGTGRRVDISREALATMYKSTGPVHPSYLNDLDGFSTIGPILFYVRGMKNGRGLGLGGSKLPTPEEISISITSQSVTLLLDVRKGTLVHHFAEFDLMDKKRPSVVLQPVAPLRHNSTYAVAVVNATDSKGNRLKPSVGLSRLLGLNQSSAVTEYPLELQRAQHFKESLIPALSRAAPWFHSNDVSSLQLMFDFHTVSEESQLGVTTSVRDGTLRQIRSSKWGGWGDHNVRVIKKIDRQCRRPKDRIARTIHGEILVPWFLDVDSPRHRASFINLHAVRNGTAQDVEPVKFVVLIPCSLVNKGGNHTNLTAVVDFGHSFLYSRQEVIDSRFLHMMANDNGYILVASNWRGMSRLDLPIVLRTFVAEPNLFRAARDNLIQGLADRAAIQHFCRHGLLSMDFLDFDPPHAIDTSQNTTRFFFYGISQGGILGGAYSALMGKTGLLDGAILGNPGTPFALLMPRSDIFPFYLSLLLLNLHHRRHVRIFISLMQMAWDSVEGSGVLAPPLSEPSPPTLIQTGLGDSTVTTIGAEILARAYHASTLPGGPRLVYGLAPWEEEKQREQEQEQPNTTQMLNANIISWSDPTCPRAILTELLYEREVNSFVNKTKSGGIEHNDVHWCTRLDSALQEQVVEFISRDRLINPCVLDGCIRSNATC